VHFGEMRFNQIVGTIEVRLETHPKSRARVVGRFRFKRENNIAIDKGHGPKGFRTSESRVQANVRNTQM